MCFFVVFCFFLGFFVCLFVCFVLFVFVFLFVCLFVCCYCCCFCSCFSCCSCCRCPYSFVIAVVACLLLCFLKLQQQRESDESAYTTGRATIWDISCRPNVLSHPMTTGQPVQALSTWHQVSGKSASRTQISKWRVRRGRALKPRALVTRGWRLSIIHSATEALICCCLMVL